MRKTAAFVLFFLVVAVCILFFAPSPLYLDHNDFECRLYKSTKMTFVEIRKNLTNEDKEIDVKNIYKDGWGHDVIFIETKKGVMLASKGRDKGGEDMIYEEKENKIYCNSK